MYRLTPPRIQNETNDCTDQNIIKWRCLSIYFFVLYFHILIPAAIFDSLLYFHPNMILLFLMSKLYVLLDSRTHPGTNAIYRWKDHLILMENKPSTIPQLLLLQKLRRSNVVLIFPPIIVVVDHATVFESFIRLLMRHSNVQTLCTAEKVVEFWWNTTFNCFSTPYTKEMVDTKLFVAFSHKLQELWLVFEKTNLALTFIANARFFIIIFLRPLLYLTSFMIPLYVPFR